MRMCGRSAPRSCTFPRACWSMACIRNEDNNGTQWKSFNFNNGNVTNTMPTTTDVWFLKAGIKRTLTPLGATVMWGEWWPVQQHVHGLCGAPGDHRAQSATATPSASANLPTGKFNKRRQRPSRWRARHGLGGATAGALVWCRRSTLPPCMSCSAGSISSSTSTPDQLTTWVGTARSFGRALHISSFQDLDIFQARWRDLLLNQQTTYPNGSRPFGRLLFCALGQARAVWMQARWTGGGSPASAATKPIGAERGCGRLASGAISWAGSMAPPGKVPARCIARDIHAERSLKERPVARPRS